MKVPFLVMLLLGSFLAFATPAQAQSYQTAVGLRLGSPTGVTLKHFLSPSSAVELQVGSRRSFGLGLFSISPSFQLHQPLSLEEPVLSDLQWYWGVGASVLLFNTDQGFSSDPFYSADAYLGLEYTFEDLPICLSLDWTPRFFLGSLRPARLGVGYGALAVRYVLK